jgi:hypothetical protein
MAFFDSKEEVINIELTSYGKYMLSKGLLKPFYYSFHDEDVLYDVEYAGTTENVSNAEVRIQEETLYVKPMYSFVSPKPYLDKSINQTNFINNIDIINEYKVEYFDNSIGDSTISNLYVASWNVNLLSKKVDSVERTFGDNLSIPQLNCSLSASVYKTTQTEVNNNLILLGMLNLENSLFTSDNNVYISEYEDIIIKIEEDNTDADMDKFDVEVFEIQTDANGIESYISMKFAKEIKYVDDNNILQIVKNNMFTKVLDDTFVDKFFEINMDKSIENSVVCKHILKSTKNQDQIFSDINICDDTQIKYSTNKLYDIIIDNALGKNC